MAPSYAEDAVCCRRQRTGGWWYAIASSNPGDATFHAAWDVATDAKTITGRRHARNDEGYDARARRRSDGYGGDATDDVADG